jgi:hypothetical protein
VVDAAVQCADSRVVLHLVTARAAELPTDPVPGRLRVLIVTGGHAFDEAPFFAMFDRMPGILWGHVRYGGEAEKALKPETSGRYDALLFYDMNQQQGPHTQALEQILGQGKPAVFLHHAIGSYPEWTDYAQVVGGHANFGGRLIPGVPNTKFLHDVWMHVEIADPRHPITQDLRDFDIYDEAYKNVGISSDVHVLLRTSHPASDRAIAWTHRYKKSRVVYLQLGHGPQAFSHPIFETLVHRSLLWSAGRTEEK